jgi:hypothetical protein
MRLGIVTDIHLAPPDCPPGGWHNPHQFATVADRLARSLTWLTDRGAARILVGGDLTHHGDAKSMDAVLDILDAAPVPAWIVPGNHDLDTSPDMLATRLANRNSSRVSFLNGTGEPLGTGWHALGLGLERHDGAYHATGLPESGIPNLPLLVLSHFPVLSLSDAARTAQLKYAGDLANRETLAWALRAREAPSLVICGHLHIRHTQTDGPILQIANSAQIESLFEVTLLDIGDEESGPVTWETVSIDDAWPGVDPGLSPRTQIWSWTGSVWLQEA